MNESCEKCKVTEGYYILPKVLMQDSKFREMSIEAKVLYSMMLDREKLSQKNNWKDERGEVYIIYTLKEIQSVFNCGKDKSVKIVGELEKEVSAQ